MADKKYFHMLSGKHLKAGWNSQHLFTRIDKALPIEQPTSGSYFVCKGCHV